ncbi:WD40 repeat domain-containing protein [Phreatobacter sp.]|uniref:WD40 repeat domain-containing protein n=1 Tax=Phreatobacter sp. TaxID=1966341 RepID=UPI0025FEB047|nr:WD40 repeat domain-containing protein [Phreatobacter sp.]
MPVQLSSLWVLTAFLGLALTPAWGADPTGHAREEAERVLLRTVCKSPALRESLVKETIENRGEDRRASAIWDTDTACAQVDLPTIPVHDTADPADSATHTDWVYDARWSPDGNMVVTAGRDGTVRIWDVATGKTLRVIDIARLPPLSRPRHGVFVRAARFIGDGSAIIVTADHHPVRIFEVASGEPIAEVPYTHNDKSTDIPPRIEATKSGLVILAGRGSDIVVYDTKSKSERYRLPHSPNHLPVTAVFEPAGVFATTRPGRNSGRDRSVFVQVRKLDSGELLWEGEAHGNFSADAMAFSQDGKDLAVTVEGKAFVFSLSENRLAQTILLYPSFGHQNVLFTADGSRLVAGRRHPELWDIATARRVHHFGPFSDLVHSVDISPDGKYLLTSHIGSDARIWEVDTGIFFRRLGRDVYPAR